MPMSYDLQVAAWVKLAEAVNTVNQDSADTSQDWLNDARHTLLLMTDHMQPDELVRDGQLSVPASMIASLDGWDVFETGENLLIMGHDDAERFATDDDALDYVKARAASNEPGTRLHAAALTLHGVAFPGDDEDSPVMHRAKRDNIGGEPPMHTHAQIYGMIDDLYRGFAAELLGIEGEEHSAVYLTQRVRDAYQAGTISAEAIIAASKAQNE